MQDGKGECGEIMFWFEAQQTLTAWHIRMMKNANIE